MPIYKLYKLIITQSWYKCYEIFTISLIQCRKTSVYQCHLCFSKHRNWKFLFRKKRETGGEGRRMPLLQHVFFLQLVFFGKFKLFAMSRHPPPLNHFNVCTPMYGLLFDIKLNKIWSYRKNVQFVSEPNGIPFGCKTKKEFSVCFYCHCNEFNVFFHSKYV